MSCPDRKTVERLRAEYPVGCRIVLDEMDDKQAPKIGTQGTCMGVDDAGSIMVSRDSGGSLNVAYGADSCHRVASEGEIKESLDHLGKTRQTGPRCPGAEQSRTVTIISSRHSAGGQTSKFVTAVETSKRWKISLETRVCWQTGQL